MNQTTVPHIVASRINLEVSFPEDIEGDLVKEHNFLIFDERGPKLMVNYKQLFEDVCKEVDYAVSEGVAHFGDDGIISMTGTFYER